MNGEPRPGERLRAVGIAALLVGVALVVMLWPSARELERQGGNLWVPLGLYLGLAGAALWMIGFTLGTSPRQYATYADVPLYRKRWFFWLTFLFWPVPIGLLVTGDVYYPKQGHVSRFGRASRIAAALIWPVLFLLSFNR